MLFKSTRNSSNVKLKGFEEVLLSAYADDGGLFVPLNLPNIPIDTLKLWKNDLVSFPDICAKIVGLFTTGIEQDELQSMARNAFKDFNTDGVTESLPLPLTKLDNLILLDTSLGPTFAFKDIGQQMMGQLINHVLGQQGKKASIIIETSGDTGPAAIAGVKGCEHVNIFCLYPNNRISRVQELQMIAVAESNVHVFRTEGDSDEQASVLKEVFADEDFVRQFNVCSVNSINWFRIAAQASYYVWSYLQVADKVGDPVTYIVPTGAFGNAMAGYLAKLMGLPIDRIVCATNANDIVHRTLTHGDMRMTANLQTESPAMDIQFAYNLERLLYYAGGEDASVVRDVMADVEKQYRFQSDATGAQLSPDLLSNIHRTFSSISVSDELTLDTIQQVYSSAGVVLCPHSAISVYAGLHPFQYLTEQSKVVCVLTANPVKFASTVKKAIGEECWERLPYPEKIARLELLPERFEWLRKSSESWRDEWISVIKQAVIAVNSTAHSIT